MRLSGYAILLAGLLINLNSCSEQENTLYGTGEWDFSMPGGRVQYHSIGTQRAVVKVTDPAEIVHAHLPWRRRDFEPENVEVLIYDAITGEQIKNIYRVNINREFGDMIFQPETIPGEMDLSSVAKTELIQFQSISKFHFSGKADKNEYYAFQVGLMALASDIEDIEITYGDLKAGNYIIPASAITCFNKEGTNWDAKTMTKTVSVKKGTIHALWFGIDIPEEIKSKKI